MARQQPLLVKPKDEPQARQRLLLHELKDRSLWFVRIRWWMPPAIWAGLVMARAVGVRMPIWPLLGVSLFILGYNAVFQRWHQRFVHEPALQTEDILRRFTRYQVMLDFRRCSPSPTGRAVFRAPSCSSSSSTSSSPPSSSSTPPPICSPRPSR